MKTHCRLHILDGKLFQSLHVLFIIWQVRQSHVTSAFADLAQTKLHKYQIVTQECKNVEQTQKKDRCSNQWCLTSTPSLFFGCSTTSCCLRKFWNVTERVTTTYNDSTDMRVDDTRMGLVYTCVAHQHNVSLKKCMLSQHTVPAVW